MNLTTEMQPLATPFLFQQAEVRTATDEKGEAWFCAKDVFTALDIKWGGSGTSLRNVPEEWLCPLYLRGQSGSGEVLFISEAAVYRVLFRSNKPQTRLFWAGACQRAAGLLPPDSYRDTRADALPQRLPPTHLAG